jgi:sarcosine oxidase gamma subunit
MKTTNKISHMPKQATPVQRPALGESIPAGPDGAVHASRYHVKWASPEYSSFHPFPMSVRAY